LISSSFPQAIYARKLLSTLFHSRPTKYSCS